MKKDSAVLAFLHILPRIIKTSPLGFVFLAIFSLLHSASWYFVIRMNQYFYNSLIWFAEGGAEFIAIESLILLTISHILKHVFNGIANYIPIVIKSKISQVLTFDLHAKISKIDAEMFENDEFLDSIEKAKKGKSEIAWDTITLFSILFFYFPYFVFISSYLFSLKPLLVILILLIFIPILLTQLVKTKIYSTTEDESASIRRENSYYSSCIVSREYFKETRMLGSVKYFLALFTKTLEEVNRLQFKADRKSSLINLCLQLLSLLGYLGVMLLLFESVITGSISIGAFAAVFQGINDVYKLMEEVIYSSAGGMMKDIGYVKKYTDFMRMKEKNHSEKKATDNWRSIRVKNVSYRYPGEKKYALKNINLTINKGEIIAVVGENGSGKTTLMRLLSGIYTPKEGEICIDSSRFTSISQESLYSNFSAVFQHYQKYMMQLNENIQISDLLYLASNKDLDLVCSNARIDPNNHTIYPEGYNTMLSREFDGVELSGGQWQRIAIARGLYKKSQMIILDEPTAAIDPIEEANIYNDFIKLIRGKTALIVTHRLGSIKLANRIIVLDGGQIVGDGTHEHLLEKCSQYKKLFKEQKKWYV